MQEKYARKRRVSQNILHRVASYLSTSLCSESVDEIEQNIPSELKGIQPTMLNITVDY